LPPELIMRRIWDGRFAGISAFETRLLWNGTVLIKFHLRISKTRFGATPRRPPINFL
jgi:polyphosphate kinase 2 (PPK2 family)